MRPTLQQSLNRSLPNAIATIDAQAAERAARVARVEAALMERNIVKPAPVTVGDVTIGRTEYRFRGDTSPGGVHRVDV